MALSLAIVGGIASGVAGAAADAALSKRADELVFIDADTGVVYADVPADAGAVEGRALKAIGTALAIGAVEGAVEAVASNVFSSRAIDGLD